MRKMHAFIQSDRLSMNLLRVWESITCCVRMPQFWAEHLQACPEASCKAALVFYKLPPATSRHWITTVHNASQIFIVLWSDHLLVHYLSPHRCVSLQLKKRRVTCFSCRTRPSTLGLMRKHGSVIKPKVAQIRASSTARCSLCNNQSFVPVNITPIFSYKAVIRRSKKKLCWRKDEDVSRKTKRRCDSSARSVNRLRLRGPQLDRTPGSGLRACFVLLYIALTSYIHLVRK